MSDVDASIRDISNTQQCPPRDEFHAKQHRKGHKKSHNGCFQCRRRKVKCQENKPICNNCQRLKIDCKYPADKMQEYKAIAAASTFLQTLQLQSTPIVFNASDLRLFHHFLANCYPHLPLGNDGVWTTSIASFAHSYEFLVHAILGLSASHLAMTSTSNLEATALSHRVIALRGLKDALSKPPKSSADSDAMFAACYALAVQSSYIGDSVEEFLTMVRGSQLIMSQTWQQDLGSSFHSLSKADQLNLVTSRLKNLPVIDHVALIPAKTSLEHLKPLCDGPVEKKVLDHLLDVVQTLEYSSFKGYLSYSNLCICLCSLPEAEFQMLIDPSNPIMRILLGHFAALLILIYPIKQFEWKGKRDFGIPNRITVFRLRYIYNGVPENLQKYLAWPMGITGSLL